MTSTLKKALMLGVALSAMSVSSAAVAGSTKDTVIDENKQVLTNTFGNCVRTKWQSGTDACAPAPKPEPVAAPKPAPAPKAVASKEARTVYFNFDDDGLTAAAIAKLDSLASAIRNSKGAVTGAQVVGYADEMGKSDYNVNLSERRAAAVESYLGRLVNIPTSVAAVRGLGETGSVTDCKSAGQRSARIACLAQDRRVEVELNYKHF